MLTCFKTPRVARRPENWTDTYTKHMSSMHAICFVFFKVNVKAGRNWVLLNASCEKYENFQVVLNHEKGTRVKLLNTLGQAPRPALLHINIRITSVDDD